MCYPARTKTAEEIKVAVQDSVGAEEVKSWYPDGAPELHAVCRELGFRHDKSDPHRSETNGVIERTNRIVLEGTRTLLFQSGLPHKYLRMAAKCFCTLYNGQHVDKKKGTVPYVERHGMTPPAKLISFGAKTRYLHAAERDLGKRETFGAFLRSGVFAGYRMHAGGRWTGQYTILDFEAYTEIAEGSSGCAYEHAVSEIYSPGSSGDDLKKTSNL